MMEQQRLRGVMPGVRCDHVYLIAVSVHDEGHRARCLRCQAVGPLREDADAARQALLEERSER
jgi:hypothetical protein